MCLPTVFLNGQQMPLDEAHISPLDRGFIFGDGVYEVIPFYAGRALRLGEHLRRLQRSLDELDISNPYSPTEWQKHIGGLVEANQGGNLAIYIQVTRGVAKRDFAPPTGLAQTVFMMANTLATPKRETYENGISAVSLDDNRWLRCHIKSIALVGAVMLKHASNGEGADEAILFRDGYLTESSASNIAAVRNGVILCPPLDNLILPGITYELMIELARQAGLPLEIRKVSRHDVARADELWIMSSTKEVVAITTLDGKPVGHGLNAGKPGPMFWQMYELFQAYKRQ
jgi:D-alanine transaminase